MSLKKLTETEYNNKINPPFRDDRFNQLELLFEAYKLRNSRKKLRKKLKALKKMIKQDGNKNLANKIEAFKIVSTENNAKFEDIMFRLKTSYNIFKLVNELESNQQYLTNLNKERKKGRIDMEQYEITKGYYLQKIIDINDSINQLKDIARSYYQELKEKLIMLEDQRIRLVTEKLRKMINKEDLNQKSNEIESLKHQLEEKLAFLEVEIIDLELE